MVASKFGLGTEGADMCGTEGAGMCGTEGVGMCNDGDYEHGDRGSLES